MTQGVGGMRFEAVKPEKLDTRTDKHQSVVCDSCRLMTKHVFYFRGRMVCKECFEKKDESYKKVRAKKRLAVQTEYERQLRLSWGIEKGGGLIEQDNRDS